MDPSHLAIASLVLLSALLILAVWTLVRLGRLSQLGQGGLGGGAVVDVGPIEQLGRAIREEAVRGREEAGSSAKALREEVSGGVRAFQDSVVHTMAEMQNLQKGQLDVFAKQLGDGVVGIDRRVEGMGGALQTGVNRMAEAGDRRLEALQALVDGKLGELQRQTAESNRALREEVGGSLLRLGEGVAGEITRLGGAQTEKLGAVAKEIGSLSDRNQQGQEATRKTLEERLEGIRADSAASAKALREEVANTLGLLGETLSTSIEAITRAQHERLEAVAKEVAALTQRSEASQEGLRKAVEERLDAIRGESAQKLEQVRQTVDEKLLGTMEERLGGIRADTATSGKTLREEVGNTLGRLAETLSASVEAIARAQHERLEAVAKEVAALTQRSEASQEGLRKAVEERLDAMRGENAQKLELVRQTVDEKLQGTLEKRLGESFRLVSDRLEQVHKGLGEMQTLANGVGDLKRVLTNVKSRGTWGEVQLGNLLEQVLTLDQYLRDAVTRPGSSERVEFAIRLPGRGDGDAEVLLPIDAKFPHEDYDRLVHAAERADAEAVEQAARQLEARVKASAREIRDKYVNPPHTTDFAILFLPTEGLYAEVLRRPGLVEQIQRDCRVTLAGPTTLAATLNALQMGFRTLAIQKRSSEVWEVLEAVKTEFGKYGEVLDKVQKKLQEASKSIDSVSVRKRAIDRKLRAVGTLPDSKAEALIGFGALEADDAEDEEPVEAVSA